MAVLPIPLPPSTLKLCQKVSLTERHPGLQLDKFIEPPERQEDQKEALEPVLQTAGDQTLLGDLLKRRTDWLAVQNATTFACTTVGPLTLHLSRATALENAGICLHPLYGFVYLPGTGLKGMARSFAETVWAPAQKDPQHAWEQVEAVFGWCPQSDRNKSWKPSSVRSPETSSAAGQIIFHDAWPGMWPKLDLDILNNHHRDYYQGSGPPGDWESPSMVSFLAVAPNTEFRFALAKRTASVPDQLLDLARQWLLAALVHEGAGAKTAAGYGCFKAVDHPVPKLESPTRAEFRATLELVTPAFLAGSKQEAADCDLRPATLRGLLRWWWRTMHAGYVDFQTLRRLEAVVWGDTNSGGLVAIQVTRPGNVVTARYDKRAKANMPRKEDKTGPWGIPDYRDPNKVTQGLWYASFGMDEQRNRPRFYVEPNAEWAVRIIGRPGMYFANNSDVQDPKKRRLGRPISPDVLVGQAKAALWLLCHFGGLGSKGRKGFGSVAAKELSDWHLEDCIRIAAAFRRDLGLPDEFNEQDATSPSLDNHITLPEPVTFRWPSVWSVLDQVGFAYQQQAKHYQHQLEKNALGLPRRIGQPVRGRFDPGGPVKKALVEARQKGKESNVRHSSPVHFHIARATDGGYTVRVIAFPSMYLPDMSTSRRFLTEFVDRLHTDLQRRARMSLPPNAPARGAPPSSPSRPALQSGQLVTAVLVDEKTQKGGWKARLAQGDPMAGAIQNFADLPGDAAAGQQVSLILQTISQAPDGSIRAIQFRWPTDADKARLAAKPSGPPRGPRRR